MSISSEIRVRCGNKGEQFSESEREREKLHLRDNSPGVERAHGKMYHSSTLLLIVVPTAWHYYFIT
jgi:hypothetical protein